MNEEIKYPEVITGIFIFNEKGELLLAKQPRWKNKYVCIGGHIEHGESLINAAKREAKEEVNLEIDDIELIGAFDGLDIEKHYESAGKHLIFVNYTAVALDIGDVKLNDEIKEVKWLKLDEWLKMDKKEFAPYLYDVLVKLKAKLDERNYVDLYKRALADYQNLLKQNAVEKQDLVKYANERLLLEILPVFDNLKLALKHSKTTEGNKNGIEEGIGYVIKQFKESLENNGVHEIKTENEKFDHDTMDALDKRITDDKDKDGMVAEEIKAGYKLNGKVIEHAKVIVYEYQEPHNA